MAYVHFFFHQFNSNHFPATEEQRLKMNTYQAPGRGIGWADEDDETYLPPNTTTVDEKGVKTVTEYKLEGNQRVKVG